MNLNPLKAALKALKLKVANLTVERDVANEEIEQLKRVWKNDCEYLQSEIDRLKGEVTKWQKVSGDDDVVLVNRQSHLTATISLLTTAKEEIEHRKSQNEKLRVAGYHSLGCRPRPQDKECSCGWAQVLADTESK